MKWVITGPKVCVWIIITWDIYTTPYYRIMYAITKGLGYYLYNEEDRDDIATI